MFIEVTPVDDGGQLCSNGPFLVAVDDVSTIVPLRPDSGVKRAILDFKSRETLVVAHSYEQLLDVISEFHRVVRIPVS
jgi:hypothetical protein